MKKSCLLIPVFAMTSLLFQPAQAELLDYQVIFQTEYTTYQLTPSQQIETASNDVWYGSVSIDSIYTPNGSAVPAVDFTASIGGTIFDNPTSSNFSVIGDGEDWQRFGGSVEPTQNTGEWLSFGAIWGSGPSGWLAGMSDASETRYYGSLSFVLETTRDDDVIKNGRFVRGDCGQITTCETWVTIGSVQTRELVYLVKQFVTY